VKTIQLTQGYVAKVDDEDFERVAAFKWCAHVKGKTAYAARNAPRGSGGKRTIYLHRFVTNAPDDMLVDHISGDGLDCRRSNLRLFTQAENRRNRGKPSNNTSGLKGVSWSERGKKWFAQITRDGKTVHLGSFAEKEAAAQAYAKAAQSIHGEFARTE